MVWYTQGWKWENIAGLKVITEEAEGSVTKYHRFFDIISIIFLVKNLAVLVKKYD